MNISNKKKRKQVYHRRTERLLLAIVTLVLSVMVLTYYNNIKNELINTDYAYTTGEKVNLVPGVKLEAIKKSAG